MSGLNKVQIIGRLGKDPECKTLETGMPIANFSVAVSDYRKNKSGERIEETEWFSVVMFNKLADVAGEYLNKGSLVYIEGKLKTRTWEKNGETRYFTEVIGNELKILSSKPKEHEAKPEDYVQDAQIVGDEPDDLPF